MPLALLAIGYWGSAAASNAYQVAIASGRPNLALKISALSAPPYFVALYFLVSILGINGAALAWLLLNAGYVAFLVPQVHHKILGIPVRPLFLRVLMPFAVLAIFAFGGSRWLGLSGAGAIPLWQDLAWLCAASTAYATVGLALLGSENRRTLRATLSVRDRFLPEQTTRH